MSRAPSSSPAVSSQLMSNKSYEITHYLDKDLKSVSLHSHDFYELYYFISGDASYIIENLHFHLQPGDVLLISPQNLHQLDINDSSKDYERFVLWLNPRYLKRLSSPKTDLSECFAAAHRAKSFLLRDFRLSERLRELLMQLDEADGSKAFGADISSEMIVKNILLELGRYISSPHASSKNSVKTNAVVERLIEYVENNLDKDLSLDALAEYSFVSKYYLERLFKSETNTTLHQYVLKKRLVYSKQLIESGLPITEVYSKSGFNDYTHYFRAFKQEYGITPKKYLSLINQ